MATVFIYQGPPVKLVRLGPNNKDDFAAALKPAHSVVIWPDNLAAVLTRHGNDVSCSLCSTNQFVVFGTGEVLTRQEAKEKFPGAIPDGALD